MRSPKIFISIPACKITGGAIGLLPKRVQKLFAMSKVLWVNKSTASNGFYAANGVTNVMLKCAGYNYDSFRSAWVRQ